jgi:hypothetical protein
LDAMDPGRELGGVGVPAAVEKLEGAPGFIHGRAALLGKEAREGGRHGCWFPWEGERWCRQQRGRRKIAWGRLQGGAMASRQCGRAGRLPAPCRGRYHKGGHHGREGVGDLLLWGGCRAPWRGGGARREEEEGAGTGATAPWLAEAGARPCMRLGAMETGKQGAEGRSAKHRGQREVLDICWTANTGGKLGGHGRKGAELPALCSLCVEENRERRNGG